MLYIVNEKGSAIVLTPVVAVLADTDRLDAAALKDAVVDVAPSKDEM